MDEPGLLARRNIVEGLGSVMEAAYRSSRDRNGPTPIDSAASLEDETVEQYCDSEAGLEDETLADNESVSQACGTLTAAVHAEGSGTTKHHVFVTLRRPHHHIVTKTPKCGNNRR